jgi:hypothetical protein
MKLRTLTAAAIAAAFSLGAPVAAQASSSTGCSVASRNNHALGMVHNLREHGTSCTVARNLAAAETMGTSPGQWFQRAGGRTWRVTFKDHKPGTREPGGMIMVDPWGTETARSGSSWITYSVWG